MPLNASRDAWTQYAERHGLIRGEVVEAPEKRGNKYGAVKQQSDGIWFDSGREAARYQELRLMQHAGAIDELTLQPKFPLHVMELWRPGQIQICTIGTFTADFQYRDLQSGEIVIEDVKSEATRKGEAYRLRKKLAEAIHGMYVREIL